MITKLRLENFKSFREAELELGPFTVLVGTNASGKSNIRDAFRFLSGLAHGYPVAEVLQGRLLGEKDYLWQPIRGGNREVGYRSSRQFALSVELTVSPSGSEQTATYSVRVDAGRTGERPRIVSERLLVGRGAEPLFETSTLNGLGKGHPKSSNEYLVHDGGGAVRAVSQPPSQSLLSRYRHAEPDGAVVDVARAVGDELQFMLFFDFLPDAMRRPSPEAASALGDHGENLSSVLQSIVAKSLGRRQIAQWVSALTPADITDLTFAQDLTGNVALRFKERGTPELSIDSASDGTLRFLGILAALFQPLSRHYAYFFDEIDAGIHPTRQYLVVQLIEQQVASRLRQVIASTHSPTLLQMLSPATLENTNVCYRLEGQPDTRVKRLLDIPHAREVLRSHSISHLFEAGWLEDALAFTDPAESTA